jgi:hypothetical protein
MVNGNENTSGERIFAEGSPEHEIADQRERQSRETGEDEQDKAPLTKQPPDEIERRPERVVTPGGK